MTESQVQGIDVISNRIFIVKNNIIKSVIDWFKNPGTYEVFYNYSIRKKGRPLNDQEKYTIKRNTLKAKPAEMCEFIRLGLEVNLENILRSNIKGDGGIDVQYGIKEIDVKTRDGEKFGISISKHLIEKANELPNRYFSAYTVIHPNGFSGLINENLDFIEYRYEGIVHISELLNLKNRGKLINKFKDTWEVPIEHFKIRNK